MRYIPLSVLYFIRQCLLIRHGPFLSFFEDKGHSNCAVWTRYFIGGALIIYIQGVGLVCYWCGVYNDTLAIAIVKPGLAPSAAGVALRRNEQKIRVTAFDFQGICKTTRSGNSGLLTNRK